MYSLYSSIAVIFSTCPEMLSDTGGCQRRTRQSENIDNLNHSSTYQSSYSINSKLLFVRYQWLFIVQMETCLILFKSQMIDRGPMMSKRPPPWRGFPKMTATTNFQNDHLHLSFQVCVQIKQMHKYRCFNNYFSDLGK